jgi:hypothetical protein
MIFIGRVHADLQAGRFAWPGRTQGALKTSSKDRIIRPRRQPSKPDTVVLSPCKRLNEVMSSTNRLPTIELQ